MAATVHNYEAGDVVSITSQKGFYTEEFGEINRSKPGGPGLLRLNPGIETKYSICFIDADGDGNVDTTECIWIPIPNTIGVMAVHGYGLNFPIPPTDEGVNLLRSAFRKVRGAAANVLELGSPSPRENREQRDAPSDDKRMYITDEGMQAFDDVYTREQERVQQLKGPEALSEAKKIRQDRADILSFINEKRSDKEIHARFGDSEFHRMKAEGHYSYNEEDWHFYESEESEETVADSSGQDLYNLEGPESVFEAGKETSETRPDQDTDLVVSEPEVSTEVSDSPGPKASRNGKRALGNIANLGRSFAIGKLAQTDIGQKLGVEARTHRMLAHIPIETAVVFLSDMPELGVEKNDKGTVKLGPRGREKVVYFGEGEYVIPKQNTILGLATSAPTQATSVTAITGKWGATSTTPSSVLSSIDPFTGRSSRSSIDFNDGLPPGFNAEHYASLSRTARNQYLRSFKSIDIGYIGTAKERNTRPSIERKIQARLRKENQHIQSQSESEERRKNKAPRPPSATTIRESMVKVVFDEETDRWVALIQIPSDRVPSTAVAPGGIDLETSRWKPISTSERNKIQNVIEEWKRLNPSKIPNYEIRDKLKIGTQDSAIRDIYSGNIGMDRSDIDDVANFVDDGMINFVQQHATGQPGYTSEDMSKINLGRGFEINPQNLEHDYSFDDEE